MKRRLLFLFAVFMVATSVGWGQTDLYVSTSGSDGNGGGVEAPLATIARAIEKPRMGLPFIWQRELFLFHQQSLKR